jgi:hypothetical protein
MGTDYEAIAAVIAVIICGVIAYVMWPKISGRERQSLSPDSPTTGNSGDANFQSLEKTRNARGVVLIIGGAMLVLCGFISYLVAADRAIESGVMDYKRADHAALQSAAGSAATFSTILFLAGVVAICGGVFMRRTRSAWSVCVAITGGIAAAIALWEGIDASTHGATISMYYLALLPGAFAAIGAVILLGKSSDSAKADAIPEMVLAALGIGAGALPWRVIDSGPTMSNPWDAATTGWAWTQGALFSSVYLALGLLLLITGGKKSRPAWRSVVILLCGIAGCALTLHFKVNPPQPPPGGWVTQSGIHFLQAKTQIGFLISVVTALLTVLAGALQLRNRASAESDAGIPARSSDGEPHLSRCALWGAIWAGVGMLALVQFAVLFFRDHQPHQTFDEMHMMTSHVILASFFGALTASAVIGTTIVGAIAVGQIKRSGGKLYGLRLAVADLLCFPLLVLSVIVASCSGLWSGWGKLTGYGSIPAIVVCFFVARAAWRAIAGRPPAPANEIKPGAENDAGEPRLSRCALWGAIWVAVGPFCAAVIYFLYYTYRMGPGMTLVCIVLGLLAISSIIGGTITSYVAVSRIRKSNGQLTGLPFAAFGVSFYPLLLLGAAAFGLTHLIQIALWTKVHTGYNTDELGHLVNPHAPPPNSYPGMTFMILDSIVALTLIIVVALFAWRKIAGVAPAAVDPRTGVKRAAVAMMVGAMGSALMAVYLVADVSHHYSAGTSTLPNLIYSCLCSVALIIMAVVVIRGAVRMLNVEDYAASRRTAFCSFFSMFGIVSLPAGIYALVVLARPEVKALFADGQVPMAGKSGD